MLNNEHNSVQYRCKKDLHRLWIKLLQPRVIQSLEIHLTLSHFLLYWTQSEQAIGSKAVLLTAATPPPKVCYWPNIRPRHQPKRYWLEEKGQN